MIVRLRETRAKPGERTLGPTWSVCFQRHAWMRAHQERGLAATML